MRGIKVIKPFEEIVVDGRRITIKRVVAVTPTHIVVEHVDGRIEAIPLERVSSERKWVAVPV